MQKTFYRIYIGDEFYKERIYVSKENFIGSVIGLQICIPDNKFVKVYIFGDILGAPICVMDLIGEGFKYPEIGLCPLPRIGAGLQF